MGNGIINTPCIETSINIDEYMIDEWNYCFRLNFRQIPARDFNGFKEIININNYSQREQFAPFTSPSLGSLFSNLNLFCQLMTVFTCLQITSPPQKTTPLPASAELLSSEGTERVTTEVSIWSPWNRTSFYLFANNISVAIVPSAFNKKSVEDNVDWFCNANILTLKKMWHFFSNYILCKQG